MKMSHYDFKNFLLYNKKLSLASSKQQREEQRQLTSIIICNEDFDDEVESFVANNNVDPLLKKQQRKSKLYKVYDNFQRIGQGTYSNVYKATNKITNQDVAIKIIKLNLKEGISFTTIREGSLLKGLKHANVINLNNIIINKKSFWFEFEYMHTDLHKYLKTRTTYMQESNIKLFMFQILRGLDYCHQKNILHRDLKPQNILVNSAGEVKIADFGLARAKSMSVNRNYSNEVVTIWYRSADLLLGSRSYDCKIDMWSAGCIFAEMIQNRILFCKNNVIMRRDTLMSDTEEQFKLIVAILGNLDERFIEKYITTELGLKLSKSLTRQHLKTSNLNHYLPRINEIEYATDMLLQLLKYMPEDRLTAEKALRHDYFKDLSQSLYSINKNDSIYKIDNLNFINDLNII